jgi:basic amino acid/polyamine antiporter, APA family
VRALIVQGFISGAMIVGVALVADVRMARTELDAMISVTAAVFWGFFLLTGLALFVLRHHDAQTPRPFRVPFYPVLPILFCCCCAYMVYGSIHYKPLESLIGVLILLAGLPFYFIPKKRRPLPAPAPEPEPEPESVGSV